MTYLILAVLIAIGPILALVGFLFLWKKFVVRNRRKSPITRDLLRAPGTHTREMLEKLQFDMDTLLAQFAAIPSAAVAIVYGSALDHGSFIHLLVWVIALGLLTFTGVVFFRLTKAFRQRRNLSLGLDAEQAVAQELDLLMLDGYRVFHDLPAEKFNIDHVVVGRNGVFAVETKGRAKPVGTDGKSEWKVRYDGHCLQFPEHKETAPLEQAQRQADWLSRWLTSAVGDKVSASPVLMLPGWYVDRSSSKGMPVLNGRNSRKIFPSLAVCMLSPKEIQRIAHQVEQRCRDMKPAAFSEQKK